MFQLFLVLTSLIAAFVSSPAWADQAGALAACQEFASTQGAVCILKSPVEYCASWGGSSCNVPGGTSFPFSSYDPPAGPTPEERQAAIDAAVAGINASFSASAVSAGSTAAAQAFDDYIAAGKTLQEATVAAASAAYVGSEEQTNIELYPIWSASVAKVNECQAAGYSGCSTLMIDYQNAATEVGLTTSPSLAEYVNPDGSKTVFVLDPAGGWVGVEYATDGATITGVYPSNIDSLLPYNPASTSAPTVSGGGGVPTSSGGSSAPKIASGVNGSPAVVDSSGAAPAITYTDPADTVVCTATYAAGVWSTAGTGCAGLDPAGLYAAVSGAGSPSSSAGTESLLGQIRDLLTPGSADTSLSAADTALDSAAASREGLLSSSTQVSDLGFGLSIAWPVSSCVDPTFVMPGFGGQSLTVPMCAKRPDLQAAFNWVVRVLAAVVLFYIGIGALGRKGG